MQDYIDKIYGLQNNNYDDIDLQRQCGKEVNRFSEQLESLIIQYSQQSQNKEYQQCMAEIQEHQVQESQIIRNLVEKQNGFQVISNPLQSDFTLQESDRIDEFTNIKWVQMIDQNRFIVNDENSLMFFTIERQEFDSFMQKSELLQSHQSAMN